MKRIYQLMTAIVIALFIVLLPSMVKAADEEKTITLEGVYITSPAGEYKTGDTLKFEARFSENLASDNRVPTLRIKIGEKSSGIYNEKSIENNVIKYELEIQESNVGKVSFEDYDITTGIKNEAGEYAKITGNVNDFSNSVEITVNTPEWTDVSNMKYSVINLGDDVASTVKYKMNFENIEYNKEHDYYVFFTHNNEELNIEKDENGKITNAKYNLYETLSINIDDEIELSGDIYFYVIEEQDDNSKKEFCRMNKTLIEKQKITRPEQRKLTKRIYNSMINKESGASIYFDEPFSKGRKLNIKIGKISDKTILNAIKNKESVGIEQLLNYAKQQTNVKNYTVVSSDNNFAKLDNFDLEMNKGEYYYAYFSMDNENGKYVDVEDVMLYQVSTLNEKYLISMNDSNFKWYEGDDSTPTVTPTPEEDGKDDSNTKKDDTTIKTDKLPQTGVGIGLTLAILLVALFGVVMFKKVRDYKEI